MSSFPDPDWTCPRDGGRLQRSINADRAYCLACDYSITGEQMVTRFGLTDGKPRLGLRFNPPFAVWWWLYGPDGQSLDCTLRRRFFGAYPGLI